MRVTLFLCCAAATSLIAQQPATQGAPPASQRHVEFSGMVLVNGFFDNARVNNSDVPQFVDSLVPVSAGGGTIRQTRLGVLVTEPDVLGGSFSGEVDADFFGGQQPSAGGRTFPLLRLRRAVGTVTWAHAQLLFGQESPLVAERSPRSLASVGFPDFAGAGNLWLWLPQFRVTVEAGYTLRLAFQAAVLTPTSGAAQGAFNTQPDSAERSQRPFLEARVRLGWGPTDDPSEFAIGAHQGWLRGFDATTGDSLLSSQALTADLRVKQGVVELIGEGFVGKALAGLGGGGIGQNTGAQGVPVRTHGGWAQLNVRPVREWMFGGGCGLDDPKDADILGPGLTGVGRLKNFVCEGHVEWRPPGPLLFAFEGRRLKTTWTSGEFTANHLNLAAAYRF